MVARHHDDVAAGIHDPAEETVVEFLRPVARRAGVEDVPGDDQNVDALLPDGVGEPVQKGREGFVALAAVQRAAEMPVRGMQNPKGVFHVRSVIRPQGACRYR